VAGVSYAIGPERHVIAEGYTFNGL